MIHATPPPTTAVEIANAVDRAISDADSRVADRAVVPERPKEKPLAPEEEPNRRGRRFERREMRRTLRSLARQEIRETSYRLARRA